MGQQRIAFISDHASPLAHPGSIDAGGQNVYVRELAIELSKLDYIIDIFTRRDSIDQPELVEWLPNIRVIHVNAGPANYIPKEQLLQYMDEFSSYMVNFIKSQRVNYSLVHANFFMSGIVAARLKETLKIPFVITFHALGIVRALHQKEADKFPKERIFYERMIVSQADKIIAECPQDAEDLINLYLAPPDKMDIIPCGFNPSEFHPVNKTEARKKLGLEDDDKILLSIGRIVPRKGIENIIKSLRFLKRHFTNVKLLVVGGDSDMQNGPSVAEMKRLKELAIKFKLEDKVVFTGPRLPSELKHFYSAADIFISTPWYEPFGITPLESMACGTPVIGSEVGGIKYTVVDGVTGFLVPPKKPLKLARKITALINNPQMLHQMQYESIKRVNSLFTWQRVASELMVAYSTVAPAKFIKRDLQPSRLHVTNIEPSTLKHPALIRIKDWKHPIYKNN